MVPSSSVAIEVGAHPVDELLAVVPDLHRPDLRSADRDAVLSELVPDDWVCLAGVWPGQVARCERERRR